MCMKVIRDAFDDLILTCRRNFLMFHRDIWATVNAIYLHVDD